MMIRSGLHQPAALSTPARSVVRPLAVALSGQRWFSMNPKKRDEELVNKTFSDRFDESDALETGKKEVTKQQQPRYNGPIYRPIFEGFDDFFSPSFFRRDPFTHFRNGTSFDDWMPMLHSLDPKKTLLSSSPGYKITETDTQYEIVIDVPEGLQASDMEVNLSDNVMRLTGGHKHETDNKIEQTWFDKRFTIGPNVDTPKMTANFSDGTLVVTAPKIQAAEEASRITSIPITEKPHEAMTEEEVVQKSYSDAFDESDWAETGKPGP